MKRVLRHLSQLLPVLLTLGLFAFTLRSADLGRALGLVGSLGWIIPLLLLPNLVATAFEALGWWLAFARLGGRPRYRSLLAVRFMVDAVMLGLPSGTVISESLQPYLLKRRCGVPFETGIIAGFGRKFLVVLSHGLFLTVAVFLAWPTLQRASRVAIHRGGLPWLLLAVATTLVTLSIATAAVSGRGRLGDRTLRGLSRFGGRWLGPWLEQNALRFQRADEHLSTFFSRDPGGLVPPLACYACGWLARSAETLVFLRLLGVSVALSSTMVIETTLILVRALAVPVPAGLGVQDAGYVLSLKALAVADATTVGAAFVLLKRGKDLFWIGFGFLLLLLTREPGEAAIPTRPVKPGEGGLPAEEAGPVVDPRLFVDADCSSTSPVLPHVGGRDRCGHMRPPRLGSPGCSSTPLSLIAPPSYPPPRRGEEPLVRAVSVRPEDGKDRDRRSTALLPGRADGSSIVRAAAERADVDDVAGAGLLPRGGGRLLSVRGLGVGRTFGRRSLLVEAEAEPGGGIDEGGEGDEGDVHPLRGSREAQGDREGVVAHGEVPVLVLQDDRHFPGMAGPDSG